MFPFRNSYNTIKTSFGKAIELVVQDLYNFYNSEDNAFEPNQIYPFNPFQISQTLLNVIKIMTITIVSKTRNDSHKKYDL